MLGGVLVGEERERESSKLSSESFLDPGDEEVSILDQSQRFFFFVMDIQARLSTCNHLPFNKSMSIRRIVAGKINIIIKLQR